MIRTGALLVALSLGLGCGREGSSPIPQPDAAPDARPEPAKTAQKPPEPSETRSKPKSERSPVEIEAHWSYAIEVGADLRTARVRMCFPKTPPTTLAPEAQGLRYVSEAAWNGEGSVAREGSDAMHLDAHGPGCLSYRVDLGAVVDAEGKRAGESVLVSPEAWLLRSDPLPEEFQATVRFSLPKSMDVSVSWATADGGPHRHDATYVVDRTIFDWLTQLVLGRFERQRETIAEATFDIITMDEMKASRAGIKQWMEQAAGAVAMLYGRFPIDHVQVVLRPVRAHGGAVYFGRVGRGGGAGVYFRVDAGASAQDFLGGWTTTHEFLHLGMPFVADSWMSEGFASYYTEVMRTRAAVRSEQEGWDKLAAAFARGRNDNPGFTLQRASDGLFEDAGPQRVYWGGAAIAFLLDVQMRLDPTDHRTLDDAMRELHRCCRTQPQQWEAKVLLRKLDKWYGKPIFTKTAGRQLRSKRFPPVDDSLAALGITVDGETTKFDDGHAAAAARSDLMAPR